jgi:membrane-bound hydrogenase subunit beta
MSQEENIKQDLIAKFGLPEASFRIPRERRIFVEVGPEKLPAVFDHVVRQLKFCHLCTITGFDDGDKLSIMYHIAQDRNIIINIKTSVPKDNPKLKTVTSYFPSADAYEREVIDLLGFQIEGLPPGNRYPLTDDWPKGQYPLRKDWKYSETKG